MKKILILSDSHGRPDNLHRIELLETGDFTVHCGDGCDDTAVLSRTVFAVRGNMDFDVAGFESELMLEAEGRKIFITHGHGYDVKASLVPLYLRGKDLGAQIILFGHTHEACVYERGGILMINPGSASEHCYAVLQLSPEEKPVVVLKKYD